MNKENEIHNNAEHVHQQRKKVIAERRVQGLRHSLLNLKSVI